MRQSWETMTSASAGHIVLTPTQPVGSGRPQRESNAGPPHQESRAPINRSRAKQSISDNYMRESFDLNDLSPLAECWQVCFVVLFIFHIIKSTLIGNLVNENENEKLLIN